MNKTNNKRKKIERNEFGFFTKRLLELENKNFKNNRLWNYYLLKRNHTSPLPISTRHYWLWR